MKTYSYKSISEKEYLEAGKYQKIFPVDYPNYYYQFNLCGSEYFISSNGVFDQALIRESLEYNSLVLVFECRLFVFSILDGTLKLMMRLWSPEIDALMSKSFVIVLSEREIYKIELLHGVLYHMEPTTDTITEYQLNDGYLEIISFDGELLKLKL